MEYRAAYASAESQVALAEGRFRLALEAALRAIDEGLRDGLAFTHENIRLAFPDAIDAAMGVPDLDEADRLVGLFASRSPGEIPPFLRAQIRRARALLSAARGEDDGFEEGLMAAESALGDLGYPYWTARAQLDLAEWLARQGRIEEAATCATDAATTFRQLGARPMLARAQILLEPDAVSSVGGVESPTVG